MNPKSTPIELAKSKTNEIQQELAVAGAELHLTNTALERELPHSNRKGDVGRALQQNAAIEEKVQSAAEDLREVTHLLKEEIGQRVQLEHALAKAGGSPPARAG